MGSKPRSRGQTFQTIRHKQLCHTDTQAARVKTTARVVLPKVAVVGFITMCVLIKSWVAFTEVAVVDPR